MGINDQECAPEDQVLAFRIRQHLSERGWSMWDIVRFVREHDAAKVDSLQLTLAALIDRVTLAEHDLSETRKRLDLANDDLENEGLDKR